jgi:predicted helicase
MEFKDFIIKNKFKDFLIFEKKLKENLKKGNFSKKNVGDIFEEFNFFYFKINNEKLNIKNCWRQKEIPLNIKEKLKLRNDEGADGVIETYDNKLLIYQTKFKSERNPPSNNELKKTIAESRFSDGAIIFTNAYYVNRYLKKFNPILILFNDLENLDRDFFEKIEKLLEKQPFSRQKEIFKPKNFQTKAIENITNKFKFSNKGKYISACGTGKTITSLWIKEKLETKKTLFVVPSIWLIKQTVEKWLSQRKKYFNFYCVVSDIGERSETKNLDEIDIDPNELGLPYSTNINDIINFIKNNKKNDIVIFSTYQSLNIVHKAASKESLEFDIVFYDEAHRTAGLEKKIFSLCFDKNKIRSKKKLFMTATPKVVKPKIKKIATDKNISYYSMDDKKFYGEIFEEFSFRDAIKERAIVDYEIIIQVMPSNNEEFKKFDGYTFLNNKKIPNDRIALSLGVEKLYKDFEINKCINFSNSIKRSQQFIRDLEEDYIQKNLINFKYHIGSNQSAEVRKKILSEFKFCDKGVLSNARCLTEGVDVPSVDGVIFSDKKGSIIDIVQAVGRCLRLDASNPNKIAKIFVPIILGNNNDKINFSKYSHLFEIIEALKAHDKSLVDEINKIHLHEATGGGGNSKKIKILPHKNLDISRIKKLLSLEISKLNRGEIQILRKKLVKDKLISLKVNFQICRYTINGWYNLISRGISIIDKNELSDKEFYNKYKSKFGKKDHNVVSHMKRAGILGDKLILNKHGLSLLQNNNIIKFKEILKNNFNSKDNINFFPYKMSLEVLNQFDSINNIEFIYGIYISKDTSQSEISKCIKRVKKIKEMKIDLDFYTQNLSSLEKLVEELNIKFSTQLDNKCFELKDLLKLGRLNAEFNYYANHISTLWADKYKYSDKKLLKL